MFLVEPPPSPGDLHFQMGEIPVRIHPFFWLVALIMGMQGDAAPAAVLSWMVAVVVSIIVHEMGHAIFQQHFGGRPRIVLYGLGGLAICEDCDRSTRSQILISLAGPCAGFLFAVAIMLIIRTLGHGIGMFIGDGAKLTSGNILDPKGFSVFGLTLFWEEFSSPQVNRMLLDLLWINLLWGAVNLLPIYPLDGGRVAREVCQLGSAQQGIVLSLRISMVAAIMMILVGFSWQSWFTAIFFGYLAYSNYQTLTAYRASLW
ncbi:site-2 protease family protein [Bythopirellula polymerisocia]|uniref:Peptidase family M50 n=1 Tax=Bythopirellula polymerisocia TaxID=2528003 RepID=A0A5C6CET9_9BACT|nr:site-2 protease family protein [Bythopirellula polymerisocia]TWU21941.1 Peptidase family M50 [Bythopirellula polymerisocia]